MEPNDVDPARSQPVKAIAAVGVSRGGLFACIGQVDYAGLPIAWREPRTAWLALLFARGAGL